MPSLSASTASAGRTTPLRLHDSWWTVGVAAFLAGLTLATCLWISTHLHPDPALHTAALFVHLASLVLGLGAVLVADYYGLLWLLGRCALPETLAAAGRLHIPIWAGLAGLVASGAMLQPDLDSALTRTKLILVLVLTFNGLQAKILTHRMSKHPAPTPERRVLIWGAATAAMSQLCWWGAVVIGFLNSQH